MSNLSGLPSPIRMAALIAPLIALFPGEALTQDQNNHHTRDLVVKAMVVPNALDVTGEELQTKPNPLGEGVFVYVPETNFQGARRYLLWLVLNDEPFPLNGPSKQLTPSLRWPREATANVWDRTGLSPYSAQDAVEIVFESGSASAQRTPKSVQQPWHGCNSCGLAAGREGSLRG